MRLILVIVAMCMVLTGCTTPEQRAAQEAAEQARINRIVAQIAAACEASGYSRGTAEHMQCYAGLARTYVDAMIAPGPSYGAAAALWGSAMARQPTYVAPSAPPVIRCTNHYATNGRFSTLTCQ